MNSKAECDVTTDLFREELAQMINQKHALCVMSEPIDWTKADKIVLGWFEDTGGSPFKSTRLIASLFFLKQLFHVSDEELPRRWVENPYWQYFCGERYFQHEFPIHPTSMRNGVIGCEKKIHRVCYR